MLYKYKRSLDQWFPYFPHLLLKILPLFPKQPQRSLHFPIVLPLKSIPIKLEIPLCSFQHSLWFRFPFAIRLIFGRDNRLYNFSPMDQPFLSLLQHVVLECDYISEANLNKIGPFSTILPSRGVLSAYFEQEIVFCVEYYEFCELLFSLKQKLRLSEEFG